MTIHSLTNVRKYTLLAALVSLTTFTVSTHCMLTGLAKFKHKKLGQEVTLVGETHHHPSYETLDLAGIASDQLNAVEAVLTKREQTENQKLHVMIEAPFKTSGYADRISYRKPSCLNSLVTYPANPKYQHTEFEDIEQRKYSGAGFLLFDTDTLSNVNPDIKITINNLEFSLYDFQVRDIKDEYESLKTFCKEYKKNFSKENKSLFKYYMTSSGHAFDSFKDIISKLTISDSDTVQKLALQADQEDAARYDIPLSYQVKEETNIRIRPALSLMLTAMVDPLFEFYLFTRITSAKENQILMTGASHSHILQALLQHSNNYSCEATFGSFTGKDHEKFMLTKSHFDLLGTHSN